MNTKTNPADLSIIIPAYNEKDRIGNTIRVISDFFRKRSLDYELVIVDDGSTDGTADYIKQQFSLEHLRILINRKNRGKGASIRRGMATAKGKRLLFTDADLSTPIDEVEKLMEKMDSGVGVAIASRDCPGAEVLTPQPFYRELMGKIFNLLVQLIVLPGVNDTQCGFKLFERSIARKVFSKMTIMGFGFDVEALYLVRKFNGRIAEVPVRWRNYLGSKVSPVSDSIQMFADLFRVRWRHRQK